MTENFKAKCHKDIKPSIKAAGVIHNENNTRLWWKEGNKTGGLTIVYDNPDILKEVAAILKECQIIHEYETVEMNGHVIEVRLYRKKSYERQVQGKRVYSSWLKELGWRELKINRVDVFEIANYMIYQRCIQGQPLGKVISMFRNNPSTKKTA